MFLVKTIEETKALIKEHGKKVILNQQVIPTKEALHYIAAKDIVAPHQVPHFDRSTVDGYAVMHDVVAQARSATPVVLKQLDAVEMGQECKNTLDQKTTVYVPTGGHIPQKTTAMVMIENTDKLGDDILINKSASKWENILKRGSDIDEGTVIVKKHTKITPATIGALYALGIKEVEVFKRLKALVISTGDEITTSQTLVTGKIKDINSYTITAYLKERNVNVTNTIIIPDDFKAYQEAVTNGFKDNDILFVSGGSSVGDKDYTYKVLESLNATIFVHGINIKPGKPTILATLNDKLFIGLPGQPTSAYMVLNTFFDTIVHTVYNIPFPVYEPYIEGVLTHNVRSAPGRQTYQPVILKGENPIEVVPLFAKSGMISALKDAYGYVIIDASSEGLSKNDTVKVYRLGD